MILDRSSFRARPSMRAVLALLVALLGVASSRAQTSPDWLWQLHTHSDTVWQVVPGPDGNSVFTGCRDGQVRQWDLATGRIMRRFRLGSEPSEVALSNDGVLLAATTLGKTVQVFDVATGAPICNRTLPSLAPGLRFIPGSYNLLVAGYEGVLYELDPFAPGFVRSDSIPAGAFHMDVSGASGKIAIGFFGGFSHLYDLQTRSFVRLLTYVGSNNDARSIDFSPSGQLVAVGHSNLEVKVVNVSSGATVATLFSTPTHWAVPVFSNSGSELLVHGAVGRRFDVYRVADWVLTGQLELNAPAYASAMLPDGLRYISSLSSEMRVYDWPTMALAGTFGEVRGSVVRWASSREDAQYATGHRSAYRYTSPVNLWHPDTGDRQLGINYTDSAQDVSALDYSSDGSRIAIANYLNGSVGYVIRVFDASAGALIWGAQGVHTSTVNDLRYSPNGSLIATVSFDKTAKVWSADSGSLIATLTGHTTSVSRCFFRGNNELITVSNGGREVIRWNISTGQPIQSWTFSQTIRGQYVASSDRLFVNVGYGMTCQEISLATGNVVKTIAFPGWLAAVSRDGTTLLSSGPYMEFLDVDTGASLASLDNGSAGMEFTNDGSRVFTEDGVIDNPVQDEYAATAVSFAPPVQVISGSLSSTIAPRDNLWFRLSAITNDPRASLPVEFSATVPTQPVRLVRARIKCKASSSGNWRLAVQLFDHSTGTWSTQARVVSPLTTTPTELTVSSPSSAANFIGPDGRIRLRIDEQSTSIPRRGRPDVSIDYLRFEVVR